MKQIMILLLVLSIIPIVYGATSSNGVVTVDFTLNVPIDNKSIITTFTPTANYTQKAYLYNKIAAIISGGGGGRVSTPYYDLILQLDKTTYYEDQNVRATITMINRGHSPDRDGRLTYYIKGPDKKTYRNITQVFELIPPTCLVGSYNMDQDVCDDNGKKSAATNKKVIHVELAIPQNATIGEWNFIVEYQTNVQELITVSAYFDVIPVDYFWYIVVTVLFFFIIFKRRDKDERNV